MKLLFHVFFAALFVVGTTGHDVSPCTVLYNRFQRNVADIQEACKAVIEKEKKPAECLQKCIAMEFGWVNAEGKYSEKAVKEYIETRVRAVPDPYRNHSRGIVQEYVSACLDLKSAHLDPKHCKTYKLVEKIPDCISDNGLKFCIDTIHLVKGLAPLQV